MKRFPPYKLTKRPRQNVEFCTEFWYEIQHVEAFKVANPSKHLRLREIHKLCYKKI